MKKIIIIITIGMATNAFAYGSANDVFNNVSPTPITGAKRFTVNPNASAGFQFGAPTSPCKANLSDFTANFVANKQIAQQFNDAKQAIRSGFKDPTSYMKGLTAGFLSPLLEKLTNSLHKKVGKLFSLRVASCKQVADIGRGFTSKQEQAPIELIGMDSNLFKKGCGSNASFVSNGSFRNDFLNDSKVDVGKHMDTIKNCMDNGFADVQGESFNIEAGLPNSEADYTAMSEGDKLNLKQIIALTQAMGVQIAYTPSRDTKAEIDKTKRVEKGKFFRLHYANAYLPVIKGNTIELKSSGNGGMDSENVLIGKSKYSPLNTSISATYDELNKVYHKLERLQTLSLSDSQILNAVQSIINETPKGFFLFSQGSGTDIITFLRDIKGYMKKDDAFENEHTLSRVVPFLPVLFNADFSNAYAYGAVSGTIDDTSATDAGQFKSILSKVAEITGKSPAAIKDIITGAKTAKNYDDVAVLAVARLYGQDKKINSPAEFLLSSWNKSLRLGTKTITANASGAITELSKRTGTASVSMYEDFMLTCATPLSYNGQSVAGLVKVMGLNSSYNEWKIDGTFATNARAFLSADATWEDMVSNITTPRYYAVASDVRPYQAPKYFYALYQSAKCLSQANFIMNEFAIQHGGKFTYSFTKEDLNNYAFKKGIEDVLGKFGHNNLPIINSPIHSKSEKASRIKTSGIEATVFDTYMTKHKSAADRITGGTLIYDRAKAILGNSNISAPARVVLTPVNNNAFKKQRSDLKAEKAKLKGTSK